MMKWIFWGLLLTSTASASQQGIASWYGKENVVSCTGKRLHKQLPAAAHRHFPIGSKVKITNLKNKKCVLAIIEDRGPYIKNRIIDLNYIAASQIGITKCGVAKVKVEIIK